jgi:hypothetical protein
MKTRQRPRILAVGLFLSACSGGGDDTTEKGNQTSDGGSTPDSNATATDAGADADPGYATTCVTYCAAGSCEKDCDKTPGTLDVGDLCFGLDGDVQCKEGLACYGDRCVRTCTADKYCQQSETCHSLDTIGYCTLPNVGQYCTAHNDCAGGTRCVQNGPSSGECAFVCSTAVPCKVGACLSNPYGEDYCRE